MKIGFIGLGVMGRHMAANLQSSGHSLRVNDLQREAAAPLIAAGAAWADSPARAAEGSEIVFTSLPGPPEVEAVALGTGRMLDAMRPGSVWFDLTTNAPEVVRRLHADCATRGIRMLDAPVSGGPSGARTRRLALWVGGEQATFERCLPVLEAVGDEPLYVGPIGAGSIAKLAHNCASFSVQAAIAEAFTLGVKAGVEPLALFRALRQGAAGRKRTFDRLAEQFLPGNYDPPAFALRLAHKDMTLAMALAREQGVPMRMSEIAFQDMTEALERGWGERDSRIPMTLQEERAGVAARVSADQLRKAME